MFGTLWVSWTWVAISFPILGKFSAIISSSIFSWPFFLSSSSGTPMIRMLGRFTLSQRSLRLTLPSTKLKLDISYHVQFHFLGSLYPDGSSGWLKADDSVPPGGSHIYNWTIPEGHAPTDADPACLTWVYHSHVDAPRDIATGLIGPLITCKRGTLDGSFPPRRQDVDNDFFLLFSVVDENLSWHINENIATYCSDPASVDKEDEDFQESNRMHAINGFVFGNLPDLSMCAQKRVAWHLFGMGNEVDVHTVFFHGQMLTIRGHRTDVAHIFPATFVSAEMVPQEPGTWLISCQVNSHLQDGMQALYKVKSCSMAPPMNLLTGKVRQYFIEAHEIQWDYGPLGHDGNTGKNLREPGSGSDKFFQKSSIRIGGTYWKVRYEAFQDETFQEKVQLEEDKHLGILGPVIRAEVGDTILVIFYNRASQPFSIQPHGVFYEKDSEGTVYNDDSSHPGLVARPFEKVTYRWTVPPHAGPTVQDPACLTWTYFSAADPIRDTNSGLVGPLLVCKAGALGTDGKQKGVDKEFFLLFTVLDENKSWYSNANQAAAMLDFRLLSEDAKGFQDSNRMHAINGFLFSNLPKLDMCKGDTVAWHLLGLGTETDVHGVTFQGNTVQLQGMRKSSVMLFPHTFVMAIMQPDNPGTFEIYCQAGSHREAGMRAIYNVSSCPGHQANSHQRYQAARIYYIMAEEMEWDYCPDRSWELEWHNQSEKDSYGHIFLSNKDGLLGSRYKKAVFREYTDGTFRVQRPRTGSEEHLGILGPLIRGEVGDILIVVFKNNASRPYSMHAHGVLESSTGWPLAAEPGEWEHLLLIMTREWLENLEMFPNFWSVQPGNGNPLQYSCLGNPMDKGDWGLQSMGLQELGTKSEEELRSLLMKVKEENGKAGLKLHIQKTKIMASGPITSWQIDGQSFLCRQSCHLQTVRFFSTFMFSSSLITSTSVFLLLTLCRVFVISVIVLFVAVYYCFPLDPC
ncbi:hypothetical protein FD754_022112 [Muntiacus muntjak]|uniref:ferroxidase n=1 Tax=Muntiacus muntjak TaxID=9888 RepID=A0A5N3V7S5_MUNMU|nr:hypothetical protein FD754_022112 [Muntiacus muntjak]